MNDDDYSIWNYFFDNGRRQRNNPFNPYSKPYTTRPFKSFIDEILKSVDFDKMNDGKVAIVKIERDGKTYEVRITDTTPQNNGKIDIVSVDYEDENTTSKGDSNENSTDSQDYFTL